MAFLGGLLGGGAAAAGGTAAAGATAATGAATAAGLGAAAQAAPVLFGAAEAAPALAAGGALPVAASSATPTASTLATKAATGEGLKAALAEGLAQTPNTTAVSGGKEASAGAASGIRRTLTNSLLAQVGIDPEEGFAKNVGNVALRQLDQRFKERTGLSVTDVLPGDNPFSRALSPNRRTEPKEDEEIIGALTEARLKRTLQPFGNSAQR